MTMGKATPDEIASAYDGIADNLGEVLGSNLHMGYWGGPEPALTIEDASHRMTDLIMDGLDTSPGQRVIDIGCGTGSPAMRLARARNVTVVGVTISGVQVDIATERAAAEGLSDQVSFQRANAMELPFPDASFDAAWAIECLLHMPDRLTVLREIARVLRPGGSLALSDPVLRSPHMTGEQREVLDRYYDLFKVVNVPPIDDYPGILRDSGFQLDRMTDVGDHLDPHRWGPRGWRVLSESLRQNPALTADKYGLTPEQHDAFLTGLASMEALPAQGYLLVSAHLAGTRGGSR